MCGCRVVPRAVSPQQVGRWDGKTQNPKANLDTNLWAVNKRSASGENKCGCSRWFFSTKHHPLGCHTYDLTSGLINQASIESLLRRDVQINHRQRGSGSNEWRQRKRCRKHRSNGLLHAPGHQQEKVVDVGEDEEQEDGAEEHGHPGAMVLAKHFQPKISTWRDIDRAVSRGSHNTTSFIHVV